MKRGLLTITAVMLMAITAISAAPEKKEKFIVAGNCGMCETRIEKAAKEVEGVTEADWNKETKMLEVTFSGDKADVKAVQKAVAAVGHDTEAFKAETAVYDKLPGCCKYERMKSDTKK
jgi:copper chaperone CopZ